MHAKPAINHLWRLIVCPRACHLRYDFEGDARLRAACARFAEQLEGGHGTFGTAEQESAHSAYASQARIILAELERCGAAEAARAALDTAHPDGRDAGGADAPPTLGLAPLSADDDDEDFRDDEEED